MQTIQPFIELGFHTVPLKGELKRKKDGSKTIPKFDQNWRNKYQETFNEEPSALGGAITGAISGFVAIDCDSTATYNLFASLDAENFFHFISRGKKSGGGTIIYKYPGSDVESIPSFSIQNDLIKLDFYSDNGFVYLPTDANTTKKKWDVDTFDELPKLMGMPPEVYSLLSVLYRQYKESKERPATNNQVVKTPQLANYLAPAVELMLEKEEFSPTLFRIITPKDFRDLPQYVKHGYLHPKNVPEGRGSEYLSKVSAILGKDASIDKALYQKAMKFINNLWEEPIPQNRLMSTIITPMVKETVTINGDTVWTYDEHWKTKGFSFINKLGEAVEVFFDDMRAQYYLVNFTKGLVKTFYKDSDIFSYIDTVGLGLPPRKEFKNIMPVVRTVNDPSKTFGFYAEDEYTRRFNTFNQTPELAILNNPEPYANLYNKPETILAFIHNLVPHTPTRNYLLKWLKYKLRTFEYSPVILYFLGVHGSGKDTFVNLLAYIIGEEYISKPTTKEFLEQYNGWIIDKYFVQLDEFGNQLVRFADKQETLGKIKAYSGKENIQIRQMRTDGFQYKHHASFMMTANTNPLLLEEGDRRALIIETPNSMATLDWTEETSLSVVHDKIKAETRDFCYYLATEIEDMDKDEYVQPPHSKAKQDIIAKALPAAPRLAYYFKHNMFDDLERLADEYEVPNLLAHAAEQRVMEDDLFELYSGMTDQAGAKRGLTVAMTDADIQKIPTTYKGVKAYYYKIPTLKYYVPSDGGFDTIEVDLDK